MIIVIKLLQATNTTDNALIYRLEKHHWSIKGFDNTFIKAIKTLSRVEQLQLSVQMIRIFRVNCYEHGSSENN